MSKIIDVADLDCIYLSYDEPKKEEFWAKIQNIVPWAKRVDGVKGSDAAHKAAADASDTDWFVLIDGDNLPDPEFFNLQLNITPAMENGALRWKARNNINGLAYGNGGMSCWSKQFVYSMRTHENSDGGTDTAVEFCFDPKYFAMHDVYSTTYPNQSAKHAWRAGFREGVKMCLDRGRKPSLDEFEKAVHRRNYDHLSIWHNVGRDAEFGEWAILGARTGTYMTMLADWDYTEVRDFEALDRIWKNVDGCDVRANSAEHGARLQKRLGLPIVELDAAQSAFFKSHYVKAQQNVGAMVTEIDVIRKLEGW